MKKVNLVDGNEEFYSFDGRYFLKNSFEFFNLNFSFCVKMHRYCALLSATGFGYGVVIAAVVLFWIFYTGDGSVGFFIQQSY